ncbi:MAG: hypothetical protein RL732_373 [Bacteroidota bacterium]|jgi:hypothetical protein
MLLIYSSAITPRLRYVLDFIGSQLFDTPLTITADQSYYSEYQGPRLNYSEQRITENEFHLCPVPLLLEKGIQRQAIQCHLHNDLKVFYPTTGDYPFDVFAATFYLLSRYEEYLPHQKDELGRYAFQYSLAFREGFLQEPLVDKWLDDLQQVLQQRFPELIFRRKQFNCLLTYDIDIAYAYKNRGRERAFGGLLQSLYQGEWREAGQRLRVLRGKEKDPYDCFEWLDALHLYCRVKPVFFFLVARNRSRYDKNCPTSVKPFRELIEYYARNYIVGLHPSWRSGDEEGLLREEKEWLEVIADRPIEASRQHYLRFTLPQTYRRLVQEGIRKDYSMGYGTVNGFRASVASPFFWYDLEREEQTPLQLHPFCYMDTNSCFQMNHTPGQAYRELMGFYTQVKKYKGQFVAIWHNSTLGTHPRFDGWREMYELFMKETVYWDAYQDAG